jgi:hypothetical protein
LGAVPSVPDATVDAIRSHIAALSPPFAPFAEAVVRFAIDGKTLLLCDEEQIRGFLAEAVADDESFASKMCQTRLVGEWRAACGDAASGGGASASGAVITVVDDAAGGAVPIALPTSWTLTGDEHAERSHSWWRQWEVVSVDRDSEEYRDVRSHLLQSMDTVNVVRIDRIQHRLLWRRYVVRRDEIATKCGGNPNELRLWHGTSATDPRVILASESGFDERLASSGFYGPGIYMAEHARYPNGDTERGYFHASPGDDHRQLLLVLTSSGRAKEFGREISRELDPARDLVDPDRSTPDCQVTFDSVSGGPHKPGRQGAGENDSRMCVFRWLPIYKLLVPPATRPFYFLFSRPPPI